MKPGDTIRVFLDHRLGEQDVTLVRVDARTLRVRTPWGAVITVGKDAIR